VIGRVDATSVAQQLVAAKFALASAKASLKNEIQTLGCSTTAACPTWADPQLLSAKSTLASAVLTIQQDQTQLAQTVLRAPMAGTVVELNGAVGESVAAGTTGSTSSSTDTTTDYAQIADLTHLVAVGDFSETAPPRCGWASRRSSRSTATVDVKAMVAEELASGKTSPSAVRRHAIVLGTILGAAVDDGRIAKNPVRGVKLPPESARTMRFLEPEEITRLVGACPSHYRPMVLTAAYTGLRWGELAGLALDRVDLLRRTIRIDRQLIEVGGGLTFGPPKTRSATRTLSLPAFLIEVFAEHFASPAVTSSGLAFPGPKGAPLRRSNFRRVWTKSCEEAKLNGLVFHELRHTAAALAIANGAHPLAIKERLGHSSITVTMDTYGGLFPRLEEAIAEGLDRTFRETATGPRRDDGGKVASLRRSEA
jgi:integrase